jgi:hypothetical protein
MKTIGILLAGAWVLAAAQAGAQCTPIPTNTALITPDTVTNFVSGTVGQPYNQVIYIHPPDDTTANVPPFGNINVTVTNITLDNVGNLPPGLSYVCNPASCIYPGGVSGCAVISGTPTLAGTYVLDIAITANGTVVIIGQTIPVAQQDTIQSYRIVVDPAASGIAQAEHGAGLQIGQVVAGPGGLTVYLESAVAGPVEWAVYDMSGRQVLGQAAAVVPGANAVGLQASPPGPGIYLLTARTAGGTATKRFAVLR